MSGIIAQRSLDEVRYWSRNMKEHAVILRSGFTIDQPQFIQEAEQFYALFEDFEKKSREMISQEEESAQNRVPMDFYQGLSSFWGWKRKVLDHMLACEIVCNHYPLHVDLLSREAIYVMSVLQQIHSGTHEPLADAMMRELIFYHRMMMDHIKILCQMLDPTERELQAEALEFSFQFEQLLLQGVELDTMRPPGKVIPQMERYLQLSTDNVRSLCEFKKQIYQLLIRRKLKSRIHPLLAGHVCQEADRFHHLLGSYARALTNEIGSGTIASQAIAEEEIEREEPSDSPESSD